MKEKHLYKAMGEAELQAFLIQRGVRDFGTLASVVPDKELFEVIKNHNKILNNDQVEIAYEEWEFDGYGTQSEIFFYRKGHRWKVDKAIDLFANFDRSGDMELYHRQLGKLFGYSADAIDDFTIKIMREKHGNFRSA